MRVVKLKKKNLVPFLRKLEEFGEVWGPVKKGDRYVYAHTDPENFDLKALRTIIPPKKFFVPPRFRMFTFKEDEWNLSLIHISEPTRPY